ncbi:hypothetical protein DENIS_4160 [Desulfonema ishimotonii]|uniref:Uncharacterized protein n=1 Tax=Desulfonema ishimotonii TaxID=45657 RepID=A0A401G1T7_9BACT|nr:hypothetical protein DENIS_4160 [Desulfonema ishimotonii]
MSEMKWVAFRMPFPGDMSDRIRFCTIKPVNTMRIGPVFTGEQMRNGVREMTPDSVLHENTTDTAGGLRDLEEINFP